jgi:putative drug exporter of the RND superfamily
MLVTVQRTSRHAPNAGLADVTNPSSYTSRQAYDLLAKGFGPGTNGPLLVALAVPVDPWIPLMLFALLFGFSMDYQVFLISRIREEWRASPLADSHAVANGLAKTGRIITSAAAIMICVFAAFVLGDLRVLRVIGLGMAVAVLLDATLVRMVATPAALQLTGRANW